jgi:tetratricopeptide (TPR) repeat protein
MTSAAGTLLLSLLLSQGSYYSASEARAVLEEANGAFARGDYGAAEEGYRRLAERGQGGADVLYNLGTAHLAQGHVGPAVLHLERARRLGADGEDVEANLALALARQQDRAVTEASDAPLLERLAWALPHGALTGLFLALWAAGFCLLAARRVLPLGEGVRGRLGLVAGVALAGAVPAGALVALHAWVRATVEEGVVLAPALQARALPSPGGPVAFEVHEGLVVRLLETSGDYVRIRLPNGLEGWAARGGVAAL